MSHPNTPLQEEASQVIFYHHLHAVAAPICFPNLPLPLSSTTPYLPFCHLPLWPPDISWNLEKRHQVSPSRSECHDHAQLPVLFLCPLHTIREAFCKRSPWRNTDGADLSAVSSPSATTTGAPQIQPAAQQPPASSQLPSLPLFFNLPRWGPLQASSPP